ncbi:hypothetical protein ACFCW2_01340 [Qipengyuania sp. DSG2-2]|uniref:hypothetical protein n=1 Tax=Qipengyuania sp. DGS2-2 TaxID=3349631 RepID=UPI0036D2648A
MTRALLALPTVLGAALVLTGCIDRVVESRVESALVKNGVSQSNAECMAGRMVDRLTIEQLRKLEGLAPQAGESKRPSGVRDLLRRLERVGDTEVLAVTGSSAALCATGLVGSSR